MKIMTAARALIELLVIVAEGYEKVMTVEELKEASLNEVDFTREERDIFQQRLIRAISSGASKDVCIRAHVSPITGSEYVIPPVAEEFFKDVKTKVEELFGGKSISTREVDLEALIKVLNREPIQLTPHVRKSPVRLSEEQKRKIDECVVEQITAPDFNNVSRLNISKVLRDSGISQQQYTAVAQYAAKTRRAYGAQYGTK